MGFIQLGARLRRVWENEGVKATENGSNGYAGVAEQHNMLSMPKSFWRTPKGITEQNILY